jgi:CheY-like chemotaxis protein
MNKSKVLLVDDNLEYLELTSFYLRNQGYIVDTTSSGEEALSKIKKEKPAIVFLDLQMPKISGLELLKEIKAIYPDLPVIIVSAHGDKEKEEQIKKAGGTDFYCKGDDFTKAAQLIEMTLYGKLSESEEG